MLPGRRPGGAVRKSLVKFRMLPASLIRRQVMWTYPLILIIAGCRPVPNTDANTVNEQDRRDATESSSTERQTDVSGTPADLVNTAFELEEVSPAVSGIDFVHVSGNSPEKPFPAANGSGTGVLDVDGDGLMDLCFAAGTEFPLNPQSAPSSQLYRNRGDCRFDRISDVARFVTDTYCAGFACGDVNADGFSDVYVTCFGENLLFINLGDGTFRQTQIISGGQFSTSAAFVDFDNDGLPDLYVCNYGHWTPEENPFCGDRERNVRIFCSPRTLEAEADCLLRNEGDGTFRNMTAEAGLDRARGRAQGVLATDINEDGHVDLYIGNDIQPNFLFLNSGDGTYRELTELSGTAYDSQGQMQASMGVAGADVDRDGQWDLFVTNFEGEYNTLYRQVNPEEFHDATAAMGIASAAKPWVGWGAAFVDFDLNGWKDLIVTNGHVDDNLLDMGRDAPYEQPCLIWQNTAGKYRFSGGAAGPYFRTPHPGRGLAHVDLDNDGDWDIVITHQDQKPAVLKNLRVNGIRNESSLTLRLIGTRGNRDAIGARVRVQADVPIRVEHVQGGGSYLSSGDPRIILATPTGTALDIEIQWPRGAQSVVRGLHPGSEYIIVERSSDSTAVRSGTGVRSR